MQNENVMKQDLQNIYKEMMEARTYCQRILEVVHSLNNTEKGQKINIAFLITGMPHSNYLKDQLANIKGILRRLNSNDISALEAYHFISIWYFQLDQALLCFNEEQLFT